MSPLLVQLGLVLFLVLVNAAFAGSELALLTLREAQVARLRDRGRAGRALARLTSDPNRVLATIQVGITLAGMLASATAAVSLAAPVADALGFLGGAARPAAVVCVTMILTYLTLVVGELTPKRVALQRAERMALAAARPLAAMASLFRPVVWLLGRSTDALVRLLGGDPTRARAAVTAEELREIVASAEHLDEEHRRILAGAFEIAGRTLRQVLRPRREVVTVDAELEAGAAAAVLVEAGRSRAPVVVGDLDDTAGVVHIRDLVGAEGRAGQLARPALALPETLDVLDALRRMRAERTQMALVVDEHGGVEGIVTLEDLLEEIVGEIYDETDRDLATAIQKPDGCLELPGSFPVHDLADIGVEPPRGPFATISGFLAYELQRLPREGDEVELGGRPLRVLEMRDRAVARVELGPRPEPSPEVADADRPG